MLHNIASLNRGIFVPSVAVGYKTFHLYWYAQFTNCSLSPEIYKIEFVILYVYPYSSNAKYAKRKYQSSSAESHIQASLIFCCTTASSPVYVDS
jgi:hypothetical protein